MYYEYQAYSIISEKSCK